MRASLLCALALALVLGSAEVPGDGPAQSVENLDGAQAVPRHLLQPSVKLFDGHPRRSVRGHSERSSSTALPEISDSNQDIGDTVMQSTSPDASTSSMRNSSALSGVPSGNYTTDELEHADKMDQLYAEEHAGGIAQDVVRPGQPPVEGEQPNNKSLPILIAGRSGVAPKCVVDGDQLVVAGGAEAACLISEPMITSRVAPVEISFNINFLRFPEGDPGRTGGIFYGAPSAKSTRTNQPTIDWTDRKADHGYRIYGNSDVNKAYGVSPGPNPNRHWKILIAVDGKATFIAGPKTWLDNFTPRLSGGYIGFWVSAGTVMKITDFRVVALPLPGTDGHQDKPKTNKYYPGIQLSVHSRRGYGDGVGRFFYSDTGGKGLSPKSLYLEGPTDFRTEGGSIYASEDLYAEHMLVVKDPLRPHASGGHLFYVQNGQEKFASDTLYLKNGDFSTVATSMSTTQSVRAGRELRIGAKDTSDFASLWYSESGEPGPDQEMGLLQSTLFLKRGDLSVSDGSIEGQTIRASEYVEIAAMKGFGVGVAKLWYSHIGKRKVSSRTVYLENGDFSTQAGSIAAAKDLVTSKLQIGAFPYYGKGHATLFYAKEASEYGNANTVHADRVSFSARKGSITAKKDLTVGRHMHIHGAPGAGHSRATLWYSSSSNGDPQYRDKTLYQQSGNFGTEKGSIKSASDIVAKRYLKIGANEGSAKLWYSAASTSHHHANSLYLESGDFRTETGDIHAANFVAGRYLAVGRTRQARLYYTAAAARGKERSSVYLEKGNFEVESGSVVSKNIVAQESVKILARPGFGSGFAKLWYVDTPIGNQKRHAHTLYVDKGDFRLESGSIVAAQNVGARKVKIAGKSHGDAELELWFGRAGGKLGSLKDGAPHVLYLRAGDFETKVGDIIAKKDLVVREGPISLSARSGYGKATQSADKAELWYSHVGQEKYHAKTVHLRQGSFNVHAGSIGAKLDVTAAKTMSSPKVEVDEASCKECHFNKIYLKTSMQKQKGHALRDALVLLDESKNEARIEVGHALSKLKAAHVQVSNEHTLLKSAIAAAHARISKLYESKSKLLK